MANNQPLVLILCGGQSLRLWPLSEYKSKNFLDIFGFSPLELTIKRFLNITSIDKVFLAANQKEKKSLCKIKLINKKNIFFEPLSKNTAAAVILSLFYFKKQFSLDEQLIISPVDNLIKEEKKFIAAFKTALRISKDGFISTLGIEAGEPSPHFGYIQVEKELEKDVFSVKEFIEKPSVEQARKLISQKNSFYNSGMFITSLKTLDGEYKKYYPYYDNFEGIFKREKKPSMESVTSLYEQINSIPFDKAIMEKTKEVRLVKSPFFWKDFGTWPAIWDVLEKDNQGNVKKGDVVIREGKNNFIYLDRGDKKKILLMGLNDIFFINTKDFTLISSRDSLDRIKSAVEELKGNDSVKNKMITK